MAGGSDRFGLTRVISARWRTFLVFAGLMVVSGAAFLAAAPASASTGSTYVAGTLAAAQQHRWCFDYYGYICHGPVAVTAEASNYNARLETISTDATITSSQGWIYCATIKNDSSVGTTVTLVQRTELAVDGSEWDYEFSPPDVVAAYSTHRYCFSHSHDGARQNVGPIVVTAHAQLEGTNYGKDMSLKTVGADLEHRLLSDGTDYGWVYCATIQNTTAVSAFIDVDVDFTPPAGTSYNRQVGYLAPQQQHTWCTPFAYGTVPFIAAAAATDYNTILTTVSTSRTPLSNGTADYCVTVHNSSNRGTGVTLETKGAL